MTPGDKGQIVSFGGKVACQAVVSKVSETEFSVTQTYEDFRPLPRLLEGVPVIFDRATFLCRYGLHYRFERIEP